MKLNTTKQTERIGLAGMETKKFSVAVNDKTFRILLDSLYTNKIRAFMRELWTNAYDAHLAANMGDIPFDCHLPTMMNPTFVVRDYGISMTHEQVMTLYSTVFESTKDDSNDMVGALGLGSKSPFSYTDTFTVIARLDGEKRTYFASIGEGGIPEITCTATEIAKPGDDAQGIEIIIPCKPQDFDEIRKEAIGLSVGFDPLPQIDGVEIEPYQPIYVGQDGSFAVFAPGVLPTQSQLQIRQGCVIYPVDDRLLLDPVARTLNPGYAVIIDVPIGEVEVAASREALQLTEQTRQNVTDAVSYVMDVVKQEVYGLCDALPNTLAATKFWFGSGVKSDTSVLFKAFKFKPQWRGREIEQYVRLKGGRDWAIPLMWRKKKTSVLPTEVTYCAVTDLSQVRIVIKRTDQHVPRSMIRYRQFVDEKCGRYGNQPVFLWQDPTPRQIERVMTLWGLDRTQILNVSELTDPGPPLRLKTADGQKGLQGVNLCTGGDEWKKVSKVEDDYYFFEVNRISRDAIGGKMNRYARLKTLGMTDKPVYAMTAGAIARVKPKTSRNLTDACQQFEDKHKQKFLDIIENYHYNEGVARVRLTKHVVTVPVTNAEYNQARALFPDGEWQYGEGTAAMKRGKARLGKLEEKYPLLFKSVDESEIAWYVSAKNNDKGSNKP